ncbi:hypothetical protein IFM89_027934 [Coptis chinensis]|uniref:TRAM domain-containing protein n=1 Tax=Coptis chinensis TaxID=261450 RepID=A0A835IBR6_9MAGN|nr:hypothetical protein IFM89_027934 [Coptis chinensis]
MNLTTTMATTIHTHTFRRINTRPFLKKLPKPSFSSLSASLQVTPEEESQPSTTQSPSFYPKKNQTLELVCESLAFKGKGVCKVADTGFVLMCDRALPGERFIGRVTRKKGNYAEVQKMKTISPHWDFVNAPCEYASYCGGCKTQNLLYEAQVRAKEQQVSELITHVGMFKDLELSATMKPIVPCNIQFHYRNKMEFSFATQNWLPKEEHEKQDGLGSYALGLHVPGFFDKVLTIDKCLLQSEAANKVLAVIQDGWRDSELGLSPYDVHTHAGFLKHLMLRSGSDVKTGLTELMVSIVNNVNTSVGNTSLGEEEYILYGKPTITETLRGIIFQISANSFFQTNTHQAEVLYKIVEGNAGLRGDGSEIVLDLFCGTGTIGLTLARKVKHVYGYEVVPQAISDARRNAEQNGIHNATFVQGDLNKISDSFGTEFPKPDIVISDPNRPGMHMKLIQYLLKLRAKRIVYVSCNPATCARDLDYLCHGVAEKDIKGCYKLRSLQPVDMFPHTPHIECVALLELD